MGIDRKHQPQTYANHSTPLLNIIHISPFSTLVGMTALSRNEMTFAPPEKRLQKRLCALDDSNASTCNEHETNSSTVNS